MVVKGNDSITGSSRTNGSLEELIGGDGNDTLRGNNGDDSLTGDAGNDSLFGGNNDDTLEGGAGDDTLQGDSGDDTLDGGSEDSETGDIAVYSGPRANYSVIGDALGLTVVDNVGSNGTDRLINIETIRFSDGDLPVATGFTGVSLEGTELGENGQGGNPGPLVGTILNDTINGNGGDDIIEGLDGADTITGGDGNDTIDAGAEDDTVERRRRR